MKASISKSDIKGKVTTPSSKSYTIRGLVCAALARGESEIVSPLGSDDTEACHDVLTALGVRIIQERDSWRVSGGDLQPPENDLYCRESGATLRFMTAVSSLVPGWCRLTSAPSLALRPIEPLIRALRHLGVDCSYREDEACVLVNGGSLKGGTAELPGNISSQYVSALLFISPFAEEGMSIRLTTPMESKPFVMMTLDCLKAFGIEIKHSGDMREFKTSRQEYKPTKYTIEGDWSSASYLLAMGALSGEVEVENLNTDSLQGDKKILDFLKDMGASVNTSNDSIIVSKSGLKAIKADLTDCPDLLPTMAVLAAAADGTSEFTGIERTRIKESDRSSAVKEGLERMGIRVVEDKNRITVTGSQAKGAVINSWNDHRIAMAFSLLGLVTGGTVIEDAECVSKTFPEFWDILRETGGEVKLNE